MFCEVHTLVCEVVVLHYFAKYYSTLILIINLKVYCGWHHFFLIIHNIIFYASGSDFFHKMSHTFFFVCSSQGIWGIVIISSKSLVLSFPCIKLEGDGWIDVGLCSWHCSANGVLMDWHMKRHQQSSVQLRWQFSPFWERRLAINWTWLCSSWYIL